MSMPPVAFPGYGLLNTAVQSLGVSTLLVMVLVPLLAVYVFNAYSLMTIARKVGTAPSWLAWIPFADLFLMLRVAGKPDWWFLLFLVPVLNIVIYVTVWMEIATRRMKPGWLGVLTILPVVNLAVVGYLAFSGGVRESAVSLELSGPATSTDKPEQTKRTSKFFTEYYAVAFLFMIAAFAATAFFVHRPLISKIKTLNADTLNLITTAEAERSYLKSVQGSVSAAQSIPTGVLEQVDNALPTEQNTPSLLVQFNAAAQRNNVRIDTISFSEKNQPVVGAQQQVPVTGMISPLDVSLAIRANTYFELKRFLADIEKSLRVMDIQTLMSSGGQDGSEISYSVQLRTYTYVPPPTR